LGAQAPAQALTLLKPADWNPQTLDWARQRLFREDPELSANFLRLMSADVGWMGRLRALSTALFPPRAVMSRIFGFPPASWKISIRYLPYAASRISLYWDHYLHRLRGEPRREMEAESTLALKNWLEIKE